MGVFPLLLQIRFGRLRASELALNKRKVLDAARKFVHKGAKQKALKEYAKLLKEGSRDAKLLLEVGDAHRRWGQAEEAISHYVRVADQYMQGGFDARAVAVFKQILNLDEKRYDAYVSLAELYQRMGLDSEAVTALQTAADGYHREGEKVQALELLRKMATLDPSNTTSRIKRSPNTKPWSTNWCGRVRAMNSFLCMVAFSKYPQTAQTLSSLWRGTSYNRGKLIEQNPLHEAPSTTKKMEKDTSTLSVQCMLSWIVL
jgi:tetratricopeptide (TPR) repeat protein